MLIKKGLKAY